MHRMGDEVAHAFEHGAMPREPREPQKLFRNNQQRKMSASSRSTRSPLL